LLPREAAKSVSRVSDGVIDHLALSEAELLERVASLESDVATYRDLALTGITALADLTARHTRLRADRDRLLAEFRRLREFLLRGPEEEA
jgi:hypothetical protein